MPLLDERANMAPRIIVSGLPRSGTSMMMSMLQAAGYDLLTDHIRSIDEFNPKGYFEYEPVKRLKYGDIRWLDETNGKVIKIVSPLLHYLPACYTYKIIFMQRNLREVLASQSKMLLGLQNEPSPEDDLILMKAFEGHLSKVKDWMAQQPNVEYRYVDYNHLFVTPQEELDPLSDFLERPFDVKSMIALIDPNLYQHRVENRSSIGKEIAP